MMLAGVTPPSVRVNATTTGCIDGDGVSDGGGGTLGLVEGDAP